MMRFTRAKFGVVNTFTKQAFTISKLSSGLRVISTDDGTGISGVAIFTSNAPSNETSDYFGSSALIECMPLSGNEVHTPQEVSSFYERTGNSFKMINVKECLGYFTMAPRYHVRDTLSILTGMALHPSKNKELFESAKQSVALSSEMMQRDATRYCFENVYTSGWGNCGVGVPQIPTPETVEKLTHENFLKFHKLYTRPETTVVAATGIADHAAFVKDVEEIVKFECLDQPPPMEPAVYRGGSKFVENLEAPDSTRKFAEKNLTHIAMCMPTVSMRHKDYYPYSVIQTLMGGGTSFSSGGPGKGLHTKLFKEVINYESWIHGIECITGWFQCGGLLGLYGQCPHDANRKLHNLMLKQLSSISQRITEQQLEMAKNQLLSQLILLGESREMLLEEMGKNLLLHDHVTTAPDLLKGAQEVTMDDLHRVCRNAIVDKKLSYSVYGNTANLSNWEDTNEMLQMLYRKNNKGN